MKIWVDDIRTPPDDTWTWHKTSYETLMSLARAKIAVELGREENYIREMSLDHDLGGFEPCRYR